MKMKIVCLFLAVFILAPVANAVVLDFEDLSGQDLMPNPYLGIVAFDNSSSWYHYDFEQYPYTPSSGVVRLYDFSSTGFWTFLTPVVYNGSYFSGEDTSYVQMDLYLGSDMVFSTGTLYTSATPTFLATGYNGLVDRVVVNTNAPDFWVMDDLTYNGTSPPNGNAVPEPATMFLLGLGLIGLAGYGRKKFK